jgi:tRNA pseudouridine-54 N-methylase
MKYPSSFYVQAFLRALQEKPPGEHAKILQRLKETARTNGDERVLSSVLRQALRELQRLAQEDTTRIVSGLPMDEREKNTLRKQFPARKHIFETSSAILGGIVVQKGTRLYHSTFAHAIKMFSKS